MPLIPPNPDRNQGEIGILQSQSNPHAEWHSATTSASYVIRIHVPKARLVCKRLKIVISLCYEIELDLLVFSSFPLNCMDNIYMIDTFKTFTNLQGSMQLRASKNGTSLLTTSSQSAIDWDVESIIQLSQHVVNWKHRSYYHENRILGEQILLESRVTKWYYYIWRSNWTIEAVRLMQDLWEWVSFW